MATEETYRDHRIVVEDDEPPTLRIDGEDVEVQSVESASKTEYSHRSLPTYLHWSDPLELGKALVDEMEGDE